MASVTRFTTPADSVEDAAAHADHGGAATVADITLRRSFPRRHRPEPAFHPPWLPLYRSLKTRVEESGDEAQRDRLVHLRVLIARSRLDEVERLLSAEVEAPHQPPSSPAGSRA